MNKGNTNKSDNNQKAGISNPKRGKPQPIQGTTIYQTQRKNKRITRKPYNINTEYIEPLFVFLN